MNEPLSKASISDLDTPVEVETAINICLYQLNHSKITDDTLLFGNVTKRRLRKALEAATNFIDYTKFEMGEGWGK